MLKRIKVQGYKSLVDLELNLRPLCVLVGPNASGKSNFLLLPSSRQGFRDQHWGVKEGAMPLPGSFEPRLERAFFKPFTKTGIVDCSPQLHLIGGALDVQNSITILRSFFSALRYRLSPRRAVLPRGRPLHRGSRCFYRCRA